MVDLEITDELTLDGEKVMSADERQEEFQKYAARAQLVRVPILEVGDELDVIGPYRYFAKVVKKQGKRVLVECCVQDARPWKMVWGRAFTVERQDRTGKVIEEKSDLGFDSVVEDGRPDGDQDQMGMQRKPIHAIRLDAGAIEKKKAEWAKEVERRRQVMQQRATLHLQSIAPAVQVGTGVENASEEPSPAQTPELEVRPQVGEEAPLRQSGKAAGAGRKKSQ